MIDSNPTLIELGIDESGRGSAIGALVMYGVVVTPGQRYYLQSLGVDDSKKVKDRKKRALIAEKIKQTCAYAYAIAEAPDIDDFVESPIQTLNTLERNMSHEITGQLNEMGVAPNIVYVDGLNMFDTVTISNSFEDYPPTIEEAKADGKYLSVAAASICAKDHRDKLTKEVMGHWFDKGAGYPNEHTEKYIRYIWQTAPWNLDRTEELLSTQVRTSWSWYKKLEAKLQKGE